jgi:hypothetical protein
VKYAPGSAGTGPLFYRHSNHNDQKKEQLGRSYRDVRGSANSGLEQQTAEFFKENVDCVVYKFTTINTKKLIINEASRARWTRTLLQGIGVTFTYPRTDARASKITFRDRLSLPDTRSLPKLDPDGFLSSSKRVGAGGK